jgi:hypothetical protein
MLHIPFALCEAVSDLTALFVIQPHLPANSREVVQLCVGWAAEFEKRHGDTDWAEVEYLETIDAFFTEKYRAWIESVPARLLRANE